MSRLIIVCFNSAADPLCLAFQLQALRPQRLGLRRRLDSLTLTALRVRGSFFFFFPHHVSDVDAAFDSLILDCACF